MGMPRGHSVTYSSLLLFKDSIPSLNDGMNFTFSGNNFVFISKGWKVWKMDCYAPINSD